MSFTLAKKATDRAATGELLKRGNQLCKHVRKQQRTKIIKATGSIRKTKPLIGANNIPNNRRERLFLRAVRARISHGI
ncbi:MAG: hypothetical protein DME53_02050 [Verrucomicrobia bacterium]|nr:MAG: hypothetical protein DME56_01500 [Verrucomicrobiota bacterium]PYK46590.1 MAG: hypothetical protein DME53_02050 [Verrucomicrobiota bacterium]